MKKNLILCSLLVLLLIIVSSCKKEDKSAVPAVVTDSATMVEKYSATLNGIVSDENGSAVTARGFCVSIEANPDLNDLVVSSGFGPGNFSKEITGLQFNTTYYCKAFATNGVGTAFGSEVSFTTDAEPDPGPVMHFKGGAGYTSGDATIAEGEEIRVGIVAASSPVSSNLLARFRVIATMHNIPAILLDSTMNTNSLNWESFFTFVQPGNVELTFEVSDVIGMITSKSLNLTIVAPQVIRYNNIVLGSWNDAIGSFFATSEGIVYNIAQTYSIPSNQARIDFLFYKGIISENTIASPDDIDANTIVELKLNLWTNKNQTRFNTTTITAAQFDAIGSTYVFPNFNLNQQTTKVNQLLVGDVILFKTQGGKPGLIKIVSLYTKGDKMKIDVVMEK